MPGRRLRAGRGLLGRRPRGRALAAMLLASVLGGLLFLVPASPSMATPPPKPPPKPLIISGGGGSGTAMTFTTVSSTNSVVISGSAGSLAVILKTGEHATVVGIGSSLVSRPAAGDGWRRSVSHAHGLTTVTWLVLPR